MGFAAKPGITKLSELTIDTSKDWLTYQIKNLSDPTLDQDSATKKYHDDNLNPTIVSATLIVAASDSVDTERADKAGDGTADNIELQAAIDELPT